MIQDTELFNTRRIKSEKTHDGDTLITWEIRAKGFAGVCAYNCERRQQVDVYSGRALERIADWVGCGDGWMKHQFYQLIDGAEIAIEAANDAWASMQEERYW
jgi:hypothetical protein